MSLGHKGNLQFDEGTFRESFTFAGYLSHMTPSNGTYVYQFPKQNLFRAKEAVDPEFNIFLPGREALYVPLQHVRVPRLFQRMERNLGIENNQLKHLPNTYLKYLFSGHRGCGKTVELLRFHQEINRREKYFAVFISLALEIEFNRMEPEDLYFILIMKLLHELDSRKVEYDRDEFEDIAQEWIQDEEVQKEIAIQQST